jgi:hypothetical protein
MYFAHAFRQTHVGTKLGGSPVYSGISSDSGFIIDGTGLKSGDLKDTSIGLGPGTFGFFDQTFNGINTSTLSPLGSTDCCPLYLISASLYNNDKIGQFHGGYLESSKSKLINPKYVSKVWYAPACPGQNHVIHIGATPYTDALSPNPCPVKEFVCNENYYLRLDIKGSPVLRLLNRNMYRNTGTWTNCCPAGQPTALVDSTLVFIQWAKDLMNFPLTQPFIQIEVYDELGNSLGTTPAQWDTYVSPGHTTGQMAGMKITGAYVDTKFGNCTFQTSDFFEKEPVRLYASEVDETGDVCAFTGLCVVTQCEPIQAEGFGEQVVRDVILSESYKQNFFHSDLRLREVTQGYDITNLIDRNAQYHRYFIAHNVPRRNNPTSVHDNDQYLLEIVVPAKDPAFESFIQLWLGNCGACPADIDFTATCPTLCS